MRQRVTKKGVIQATFLSFCMIGLLTVGTILPLDTSVDIVDEPIPLGNTEGVLIKETDADINVIPDKYNCGAKGELTVAELGQSFDSMYFKASADKNIIDFAYNNSKVVGTIVFDSIDFSKYPVCVNNESQVNRQIKLIFNNCIFSSFSTGVLATNLSYEFNNCTINSFYGSNASFTRCLFGNSYNDALTPFQEIYVYDSYFCDMASNDPASAGIHTDGTQMYGHKDAKVKNVLFSNCRFEIPAIKMSSSAASINACVMIQLEYNDAESIQIINCKMNGGGYTIYAHTKSEQISLSDVCFENVEIGVAHLYDDIYPHVSNGVSFKNVTETDTLYVGSVWREGDNTLISVSNDTNRERTMLVYADGKNYTFTIPACPDGKNLYGDFAEFPFDVCVLIPQKCDYVVCFDITDNRNEQIRFVNWSNINVYYDEESYIDEESVAVSPDIDSVDNVVSDQEIQAEQAAKIIAEGICGKDVGYTVDEDGVLHLFGKGSTYDYHSLNCSPWYVYRDLITEIEIDSGIEVLGNQLFRNLVRVKKVVLPDTVISLRANVFIGCGELNEIYIPSSLKSIGNYSFCGTNIKKCKYGGTLQQLNDLIIGSYNERLLEHLYE